MCDRMGKSGQLSTASFNGLTQSSISIVLPSDQSDITTYDGGVSHRFLFCSQKFTFEIVLQYNLMSIYS